MVKPELTCALWTTANAIMGFLFNVVLIGSAGICRGLASVCNVGNCLWTSAVLRPPPAAEAIIHTSFPEATVQLFPMLVNDSKVSATARRSALLHAIVLLWRARFPNENLLKTQGRREKFQTGNGLWCWLCFALSCDLSPLGFWSQEPPLTSAVISLPELMEMQKSDFTSGAVPPATKCEMHHVQTLFDRAVFCPSASLAT